MHRVGEGDVDMSQRTLVAGPHWLQPALWPAHPGIALARHALARWFWDAIVVAYLMAGSIQFDGRLACWSQVSVNQILGILVLARGAWGIRRLRSTPLVAGATLGAVGILTLLLLVRSIASPDVTYGRFKALSYLLVVLPSLLCLELRGQSRDGVERILWLAACSALGLAVLSVPHLFWLQEGQRLAALGGGPNVLARHLGTGLVSAVVLVALHKPSGVLRWSLPAASTLCAVSLVCTGTKAVMLACAVAVAAVAWHLGRKRSVLGIALALLVAAGLPALTHGLVDDLPKDGGLVRLLRLPDVQDPLGSYGARMHYLAGTWRGMQGAELWFGCGSGAWGVHTQQRSGATYPHNILLEVTSELGVVGLMLMLLPLARFPALFRGAAPQPVLRAGLAGMIVFWLVNLSLSGDLVDSRFLWLWLLLAEGCARRGDGALESLRGSATGRAQHA